MPGLTVFLTGCARGLGPALARKLLQRGERVFAGVLPSDQGRPGAETLPASDSLVPVAIDVADTGSVRAAAAAVADRAHHLDMVFNVAGVLGDIETSLPGDLDDRDLRHTYDVNALGPLRVMNAFLPLLLAGPTRLVLNISSEAGSISTCTRSTWYAYCMSKTALNMASALVHNLLRPHGGRVVVMHPGWMRTWMRGALDERADLSPEQAAAGILAQVDRALAGEAAFCGERPAFIDGKGDPLPW